MMKVLIFLAGLIVVLTQCESLDELRNRITDEKHGYSRKHRPVHKEETRIDVDVYLSISHIERIDENEQTMVVHGKMSATWKDELLKWNAADYNDTKVLKISSSKLWIPSFALYNTARSNRWNLNFYENPASVTNEGQIYILGSFSFHVTCLFDFTAWPFDSQQCPILITDWVYSYNQVHMNDPEGDDPSKEKPQLRLSYDPINGQNKKHVGGWEITDTWRRHCLWGSNGCQDEQDVTDTALHWSLLEFGIKFKRHIPYFGVTLFLPMFITTIILLSSFWIDTFNVSLGILIFNTILQGLYGYEMISKMPPGSGGVPKIVQIYSMNLMLTALTFIVVVIEKFITDNLPSDYSFKLGFDITELPKKIHLNKLFETKGLSFDPQSLLEGPKNDMDVLESGGIGVNSIGNSELFDTRSGRSVDEDVVVLEDADTMVAINLPDNSSPPPAPSPKPTKDIPSGPGFGKLQHQLHIIKRSVFLIIVVTYIAVLAYFTFF